MTRSFIRVRPSDAVHHFRRRAAWNDGTVCGSLAHRSACNAAPPHAACPRPTPRRSTRRTAAARNTKAQIRHHPVSVHVDKLLKYLNNFSLSLSLQFYLVQKKDLCSHGCSDAADAPSSAKLRRIRRSFPPPSGSIRVPCICTVWAHRRQIM